MKTLIVTGGNIEKKFLLKTINESEFETIIAVDNGLKILNEIKVNPQHIVGDFDTVKSEILDLYKADTSIKIHKFNPIKDNTDTDIAIRLAVELKSDEIIILGAIGTRIDHLLGNIHVLKYALDSNIKCKIIDENNEIQLIDKTTIIKKKDITKKYISLIPLTEKVEHINLKGFKYELKNGALTMGSSLGISNEISKEEAIIEFGDGILIIINSKD
ncbi:MAG: thiamine diphosphokinase [Clostridia bacterium]|nr:thiamine diphosphokinase [Clostridia bacterium]